MSRERVRLEGVRYGMRGWRVWVVVAALLGVMAGEMALSVRRESVSWDEGDHLFAGYMSLKTGDLGLNPEHPPMAKMVAALPLMGLPLVVPKLEGRFFKNEAYFDGRELLFRQPGYSADTLLFRARMAVMVFALGLALLVFVAGREMFGTGAGLLAMGLVVTEPNLLTHGAFVTTDSAIACLFFGTVFALWRWVRAPSVGRLLVVGVAAGLALAAKHSAVVLLPVIVVLLVGEFGARVWERRKKTAAGPLARALPTAPLRGSAQDDPAFDRRGGVGAYALRLGGAFVVIVVVSVGVLWAFYGFRYQARPGALRLNPSLALWVVKLKPVEAQGILLFARWHVLPESWLYGLADVRRVADFMPTFFMGKVYAHGVWAYFPVVLAIKLTLGSMGLLGLAVWAVVTGRTHEKQVLRFAQDDTGFEEGSGGREAGALAQAPPAAPRFAQDGTEMEREAAGPLARALPTAPLRGFVQDDSYVGEAGGGREVWFLLVPAGVYLLVAMSSQLNIGVRHVLPVIPLLLVFAAAGAWSLVRGDRRWGWVVGVLVAAHVASSAWAFPNYMPYANEAWGGSGQTYKYLSDSNTDWGQQLKSVSAYVKANGIKDCWFAYFVAPFIEPADYGIPCRLLPTYDTSGAVNLDVPAQVSGVVLMSAADQNGFEFGTKVRNPYQTFMGRRPEAVIDHGVLVFRGTFAVPLAAAIAPTRRAKRLLKAEDVAGAEREARAAVGVAPGSFDAQEQLGKVLAQAGDKDGAREAFGRALGMVGAMEPSAQEQWRGVVEGELAGVR